MPNEQEIANSQRGIGLIVFISSFGVYLATLAPGIIWGDSASFARVVDSLSLSDLQIGKADSHPLYLLIGKVFSWLPGDTPLNLNIMSAFFGALTIFVVYHIACQLTNSIRAGISASAALCVSHAFWLHAVIAEIYVVNAFFLSCLVLLAIKWEETLQRKFLLLLGLCFLLGLVNHLILILIAPAILYLLTAKNPQTKKRLLWVALIVCVAILLAGIIAPHYIWSKMRGFLLGPPPVIHYLFIPLKQKAFIALAKELFFYLAYLLYQFPLAVSLGVAGIASLMRSNRKICIVLNLAIAFNAIFFVKTVVWSSLGGTKYTFYISDYVIFAIFIGCGVDYILRQCNSHTRSRRFILYFTCIAIAPILLYAIAPIAIKMTGLDIVRARNLQRRDNYVFFLSPWKFGEYGPQLYAEETLKALAKNSILIVDYTPWTVLDYWQVVKKVRPDVTIFRSGGGERPTLRLDKIIEENIGSRRIYIADINEDGSYYDYGSIPANYRFIPAGPVFEIVQNQR
jgi:hypothetical protein